MSRVGQKALKKLQNDLVVHIVNLSSDFFNNNAPGLLIERVRGDSQKIIEMLSLILMTIGRDGVAFVSLIIVAVIIDWTWAVIAFVGAPILIIPILILQKWIRLVATKSRNADAENTMRLDEMFHGINAIKLILTDKSINSIAIKIIIIFLRFKKIPRILIENKTPARNK